MVPVVIFSVTHSQDIYKGGVSYTIILKSVNDNRILPMVIGLSEAEAIIVEINGTQTEFPLSHDLIKTVMELLDLKIAKIVVTELKKEIYYAVITLNYNGKKIDVDSRPSDAIALALRFNAPIFISNEVMNEASYPIEGEVIKKETKEKSQIDILKDRLENAVEYERYEEAAKLRDEINKLKKINE